MAKQKPAAGQVKPPAETTELKTAEKPELKALTSRQQALLTWIVNRYGQDQARTSAAVVQEFVREPKQLADYVQQLAQELQELPGLLEPYPDHEMLRKVCHQF